MQTEGRIVELHKRKFIEFLGADEYDGKYLEKIRQTIQDKKFRFILNINELRSRESELAARIIRRPREYMVALQEATAESAKNLDVSFEKVLNAKDIQVGFEGSFGINSVSPRGLTSSLLNSLVEVEGIVVKCSNVRPKLVRSVQYCPVTKQYSLREYRDSTSLDIGIEVRENGGERMPTTSTFPTQDANGNPLEVEHGLCQYKDYQTLVLQEMPEKSKVGQLPRSVDVILESDLVDRVKPGDRVVCVGVYRSLPSSMNGMTTGVFKTVLICNNVSIIGKEVGAVHLTGNDIKHIRELSIRPDMLTLMSKSLCPSIFGHEFIKKALILQLLGGMERNLENGTHLRGDINIMMVGDPSTAKSQLLRAVLDIAPLAISTTGRGSSGVGLTAAVTMDPETGEKRLEAGAMVLADRGVVCIDEFDKMNEVDRVAIHEVMEQQTVTIAKAGIHASLNARCSVIAAANPIYGQYDKTRRPQENIGLPDSLLSRFDLLFIVLDQLDPTLDRILSEHVIHSHLYRRPGTIMEPEGLNQNSSLQLLEDHYEDVNTRQDTPVWLRNNNNFNNANSSNSSSSSSGANANTNDDTNNSSGDILSKEFLRKYIHYAKHRITPVLSEDAMERISNAYAGMRGHQSRKNLPITARTLETMIRLSTAAAKCRLSNNIEIEDVETAVELLNFVLFHEIGPQSSTTTNNNNNNSAGTAGMVQKETSTEAGAAAEDDEDQHTSNITEEQENVNEADTQATEDMQNRTTILNAILRIFDSMTQSGADSLAIYELRDELVKLSTTKQFIFPSSVHAQEQLLQELLQQIERDNKIMLADDLIIII